MSWPSFSRSNAASAAGSDSEWFVLLSIALLWPSEWEIISRLFIVDQQISIHRLTRTAPDGPCAQYTTQPGEPLLRRCSAAAPLQLLGGLGVILVSLLFSCSDLCWECRESFLFQQQRDLREYTQATVYVRKVVEDKRVRT